MEALGNNNNCFSRTPSHQDLVRKVEIQIQKGIRLQKRLELEASKNSHKRHRFLDWSSVDESEIDEALKKSQDSKETHSELLEMENSLFASQQQSTSSTSPRSKKKRKKDKKKMKKKKTKGTDSTRTTESDNNTTARIKATNLFVVATTTANTADSGDDPASEADPRWACLADRLNPNRAAYDLEFAMKYKSMSKLEKKQIQKQDQAMIHKLKQRGRTSLPFDAEDDDHCETSSIAYEHITPVLTFLAHRLNKSSTSELRIYDPYYCAGGTKQHLHRLGFPNVYNQPEDFYASMEQNTIPEHDVVVTNPPYSGSHFDRLLEFLKGNNKPFLLLLPGHFETRPSYQNHYEDWLSKVLVFLTPPQRYHYWIPDGRRKNDTTTEHNTTDVNNNKKRKRNNSNKPQHHSNLFLGTRNSPFSSLWFVSLAPVIRKRKKILKAYQRGLEDSRRSSNENNFDTTGSREEEAAVAADGSPSSDRKRFRLPLGCLLHSDFISAKKAEQSFRGCPQKDHDQDQQEEKSMTEGSPSTSTKSKRKKKGRKLAKDNAK